MRSSPESFRMEGEAMSDLGLIGSNVKCGAVLDRMDVPPLLANLARAASAANIRSDQ